MLTSGVVLLHDNARQHTTTCTWALLQHFNWELFDHAPYSPDLAPSDYHQFTYLKIAYVFFVSGTECSPCLSCAF
jgi:transposase